MLESFPGKKTTGKKNQTIIITVVKYHYAGVEVGSSREWRRREGNVVF